MVVHLADIIAEWKRLGSHGDCSKYVHRWYTPVYDHAYNFVGYRRSGEHEDFYNRTGI